MDGGGVVIVMETLCRTSNVHHVKCVVWVDT